jgi:predicted  nucleic acid-binding Zn-ribbon protein
VQFFFFVFGGLKLREQIEVLASLQDLDQEIRDRNGSKGLLLAEIRRAEDEIEATRASVGIHRAEWEEKDRLRREKEQTLQEESKRAADKRMRMTRIKNIKELQALQREVDQIKQTNAQLEEDLLSVLEALESQAAVLKEKEGLLENLEKEWGEKRGEVEKQIAEIEQALVETFRIRKETAARLNGDLIGRYELIFSRRGGMAVVAVSTGICGACHMNIPPQLWNEIISSDKLKLCPSCHRILYYKPPVSENDQV